MFRPTGRGSGVTVVDPRADTDSLGREVDPYFRSAPSALVVLSWPDGLVIAANEAAGRLLGQPSARLVGRRWPEPLGGGEADLRALAAACSGGSGQADLHIEADAGSRWWRQSAAGVRGIDGSPTLVVQVEDRSEQLRTTQRLEHLAERDDLTGAWNRRRFGQALRRLLEPDHRHGVGIVLFDVDGFKLVNDTFGHMVGDAALVAVAQVLGKAAPAGSLVARLSGDEFGVLVAGSDDQETTELCGNLMRQAREVLVEGLPRPLVLSAGWTLARPGANADQRARDAMVEADVQMYATKARGRSPLDHAPTDSPVPRSWLADSWGAEGADGRTGHSVEAWAGLVIDARDGRPVAHDVSLRVPEGTVHTDRPLDVPLAGVADLLGQIARDASRRVGTVDRYLVRLPGVPVGVAAALGWVRRAADESGLPASAVTFAVPEDLILATVEAPAVLSGLTREGFGVAVDGFGHRVGSLRLLAELRLQQVWLDPALVRSVRRDVKARAQVAAIVAVASVGGAQVGVVGDPGLVREAAALGIQLGHIPDPAGLRPLGSLSLG